MSTHKKYKFFLTFKEARRFIRGLRLRNAKDFRHHSKENGFADIPSAPNEYYKNSGWISWQNWLGTNNKNPNERQYKVNDNYFKTWSHDMAYILGFWFTDGCICRENNLFSITQHKNEHILLENILKKMKSSYPLRFYNYFCVFNIRSRFIVKDIIRLGGKERKSLDVKFPFIPKKYLPDFIRGLWDGDGYVGNTKKQKSYVSAFACGSKDFISTMLIILRKNIVGLSGSIRIDIRKKGTKNSSGKIRKADHICYGLRLNQNDTRRLRDFIYSTPSDLRMDRKYDKFKKAGGICIATKFREYLSFQDAKKYICRLGINNQKEWQIYSKSKDKPPNIPANPSAVYKNKGWKNLSDFLGKVKIENQITINISRPKIRTWKQGSFWSYNDAKKYVNNLCISSKTEWAKYRKFRSMPSYIPSMPRRVYKDKGWIGWKDWLGYKKPITNNHGWQFKII